MGSECSGVFLMGKCFVGFFFLWGGGKSGVCVLRTDDRRGGLFFVGELGVDAHQLQTGGSGGAVGFWLLAIGCWLLAIGCWLLAVGCWLLAIGYWLLAVGCWLLAIGYWLLAVGCWLLAIGYWLWHIVNYEVFSSCLLVFFMFMVYCCYG